ncbi:antibiotic biosynthesis monooxygenase [Sphingomonas sp. AR_OL41]|jgi:heme-degrading monooxygenase HmoA|uniref:antibiotic biosynthesis monooxygenase family protein n=1 Tax=Sphingomonas sp. AR_OL41 TaxID=3042729 RepID=UPI002480D4CB|nr:antibiotic biosynthesis monooxygenase [Sphingomonas sp. AR_OL41]MDH7975415.1 antibiotic biosynthesis monooxygenase [Sphingomonas sp. AR_OL41]
MRDERHGQIVVIFLSERTDVDDDGYAAAADAMVALAAAQPGYRGHDSVRGADSTGITLSYWADEASALAWKNHPEHKAIRDAGRARWYRRYEVVVAGVTRDYRWGAA